MYSYNKLWKILIDEGLNKVRFAELAGIYPKTLSAMGKGEGISPKVLARICKTLKVQPGDIMEYVPDEE
jgi:DNA-binding Xre family transcriptional regulator